MKLKSSNKCSKSFPHLKIGGTPEIIKCDKKEVDIFDDCNLIIVVKLFCNTTTEKKKKE